MSELEVLSALGVDPKTVLKDTVEVHRHTRGTTRGKAYMVTYTRFMTGPDLAALQPPEADE